MLQRSLALHTAHYACCGARRSCLFTEYLHGHFRFLCRHFLKAAGACGRAFFTPEARRHSLFHQRIIILAFVYDSPYRTMRMACFNSSKTQTTCIIGGGVIGLSTAYFLARATRKTCRTRIVVIEAGEIFGAASTMNTGCVFGSELSTDVRPLGELSLKLWSVLGKDQNFRGQTGYSTNALFEAKQNGDVSEHQPPNWFCVDSGLSLHRPLDDLGECASV